VAWRVLVKRKGNGSKTRLRTYVDSGTDAIANECAELKIQHACVVTDENSFLDSANPEHSSQIRPRLL